jgi:hypothetical protein
MVSKDQRCSLDTCGVRGPSKGIDGRIVFIIEAMRRLLIATAEFNSSALGVELLPYPK